MWIKRKSLQEFTYDKQEITLSLKFWMFLRLKGVGIDTLEMLKFYILIDGDMCILTSSKILYFYVFSRPLTWFLFY